MFFFECTKRADYFYIKLSKLISDATQKLCAVYASDVTDVVVKCLGEISVYNVTVMALKKSVS